MYYFFFFIIITSASFTCRFRVVIGLAPSWLLFSVFRIALIVVIVIIFFFVIVFIVIIIVIVIIAITFSYRFVLGLCSIEQLHPDLISYEATTHELAKHDPTKFLHSHIEITHCLVSGQILLQCNKGRGIGQRRSVCLILLLFDSVVVFHGVCVILVAIHPEAPIRNLSNDNTTVVVVAGSLDTKSAVKREELARADTESILEVFTEIIKKITDFVHFGVVVDNECVDELIASEFRVTAINNVEIHRNKLFRIIIVGAAGKCQDAQHPVTRLLFAEEVEVARTSVSKTSKKSGSEVPQYFITAFLLFVFVFVAVVVVVDVFINTQFQSKAPSQPRDVCFITTAVTTKNIFQCFKEILSSKILVL